MKRISLKRRQNETHSIRQNFTKFSQKKKKHLFCKKKKWFEFFLIKQRGLWYQEKTLRHLYKCDINIFINSHLCGDRDVGLWLSTAGNWWADRFRGVWDSAFFGHCQSVYHVSLNADCGISAKCSKISKIVLESILDCNRNNAPDHFFGKFHRNRFLRIHLQDESKIWLFGIGSANKRETVVSQRWSKVRKFSNFFRKPFLIFLLKFFSVQISNDFDHFQKVSRRFGQHNQHEW